MKATNARMAQIAMALVALAAAANPDASVPAPVPLGHWLATEEAGTVLSDSGPQGLDGEIVSPAVRRDASAPSGSALVFDGSDDDGVAGPGGFAVAPLPDAADPAPGISIAFWARIDGETAFSPLVSLIAPSSADFEDGFCAYAADGSLGAFAVSPDDEGNILHGLPAPTNVWTHVCLAIGGSSFRLYANGESVASATNATGKVPATGTLVLGTVLGAETAYPLSGAIADVRLYARALSDAEVVRVAKAMGVSPAESPDETPPLGTDAHLGMDAAPASAIDSKAAVASSNAATFRRPCRGVRRRASLLKVATPLE